MVLYILDLIGVAVFAITGAIAAGRKKLDWVGVIFLAVVTALGGGTLRDLLLNRDEIFWITDTNYLWVIFVASFATIIYVKFFKIPMGTILYADAIGLSLFTILGAQIAEKAGVSPLIVIIMGMLTGTAGGVIRDILSNRIPLVFRSSQPLYLTPTFVGAAVYVLLQCVTTIHIAAPVGMLTVFTIRVLALAYNLKLPVFQISNKQ